MNASIIIPVFSRVDWIGKCLTKLSEQQYVRSFEIIVVDDGSPNEEQMRKVVTSFHADRNIIAQYLRIDHRGPAAARNYGVRRSSGEILCFLDDDSLPEPNWLEEMTLCFQETPSVGLVNGRTCSLDRSNHIPLLLERSVYPKISWATCNIAYSRAVFDALGGFDEAYREPSWEDNDLGLRARWKGYRHAYNDKAVIYHPHERTIDEFKKKCQLNGRGAAEFTKKYIRHKPMWAIAAPFVMSRYLALACLPAVWKRDSTSPSYLRFLWSKDSLQGYCTALK